MGRLSKYNETYDEKLVEYFRREHHRMILEKFYYKNGDEKEKKIEVANDLPFFGGFEVENGLGIGRCSRWYKAKGIDGAYKYPTFRQAYKQAKSLQKMMLVGNGLKGLYNATFAIFTAKNILRWKDDRGVKHSGSIKTDDDFETYTNEELDAIIAKAKGRRSRGGEGEASVGEKES